MKKSILFIASAIAISLTACKKETIKPLEAHYHVVMSNKGNVDGKQTLCKFNISGVEFTHNATFGAEGHTYDTTVVAPWPPIVKYQILDAVNNGHDYEPDNAGLVTLRIYDQNGKEIVNVQGTKEVTNY